MMTLRIIRDCRANGFAEPAWRETNNGVVLEFPGLGVGEGVSEGVNAELRKLIALVDVTPGMNAKQLAAAIGKGHSTVERYLKTLREKRLIEFRGAPKDGGYYLL